MIDPQELLFVVDENNNPDKPLPRSEVHRKELWHRSCHIWIVSTDGKVLCQKRSLDKDVLPGLWESFFGGHILAGEDELDSALKELDEELGLDVDKNELLFFKIDKADEDSGRGFRHKQFRYVYILKRDIKINDIRFEKEEIDEIRWYDTGQLEKLLVDEESTGWARPRYAKEILGRINE